MGHGFRVRGTHGAMQIDGNYSNLCLHHHFTLHGAGGVVSEGDQHNGRTTPFPYPINDPGALIAIETDNWVCVRGDSIYQPYNAGRAFVTFYIFRQEIKIWYGFHAGLRIRNSSGKLVFSSQACPLKIVDVFNLGDVRYWQYTIPSGKRYAFVFQGGCVEVTLNHYKGQISEYFCRRIGNRFEVQFLTSSHFSTPVSYPSVWPAYFPLFVIVADITGL